MRRNVGRKPQTSANLAAFLHIIDTSRLLRVLRREPRAIMTAAAKAEAAAGFLLRATGLGRLDHADEPYREAA
nr:hypothetical protein [Sphingomonas melonis]